jgi:uncharacterized protein YabN with tetrapyrrole methylase and pyrophosphatase domain
LLKDSRINIDIRTKDHFISSLIEFLKIGKTFSMVLITWIFLGRNHYNTHLVICNIYSLRLYFPFRKYFLGI